MMPSIEDQMKIFNIPINLKHDHSEENLLQMRKGLETLNVFLIGGHEKCVEQMVLYAEMNIKFLFMQALVDRKNVNKVLQIFTANLMEIFLKKEEINEYET